MIDKKITGNNLEIWTKIRDLRMKNEQKFSQEQIASLLWINRVILSNMENWDRDFRESEINKLCEIFEVSRSYFLGDTKENKSTAPNKNDPFYDFKRIFLYVLEKCYANPNVGKTVLYKLLYFIEFNYYEKYGESLLWIDFIKWPRWPVPKDANIIFAEMESQHQIETYHDNYCGYEQCKIRPLIKPDLSEITYDKIEIIENVIKKVSGFNATEISNYSHWDIPYKATKEIGEVISKWKVFYRTPEYSVVSEK